MEGWGEAAGDPGQNSRDSRLQAAWLIKRAEETFCFAQTHFLHKELVGAGGGEVGGEKSPKCLHSGQAKPHGRVLTQK